MADGALKTSSPARSILGDKSYFICDHIKTSGIGDGLLDNRGVVVFTAKVQAFISVSGTC